MRPALLRSLEALMKSPGITLNRRAVLALGAAAAAASIVARAKENTMSSNDQPPISGHANRVRVLDRFLTYARSKPGVCAETELGCQAVRLSRVRVAGFDGFRTSRYCCWKALRH
jgi:hypothetical protein